MNVRLAVGSTLPWTRRPYHSLRQFAIVFLDSNSVTRGYFRRYRIAKGVESWARWLAKRSTDPGALALESYWQYHEETGLERGDLVGRVVVDIACGPRNSLGGFDAAMRIGVDPTVLGVESVLNRRYGASLRDHQMVYLPTTAEATLLPRGLADTVLCINAFDHLNNPEQALAEFARILRRGGELIISLHDHAELVSANEPHPLGVADVENLMRRNGNFSYVIDRRIRPRAGLGDSPVRIDGAAPDRPLLCLRGVRL